MRLCKPINTVDDWFHLAPPARGKTHWKEGRSAMELAKAWCGRVSGPAVPYELHELLNSHHDTVGAEILEAIPEHKVIFDNIPGEPRNADLVCFAKRGDQLIAISIEAKADETFGELVGEVLNTSKKSSRRPERLKKLCQALLGRQPEEIPGLGELRYQLFHGVAAAIAYAAQVHASVAIFVIHEFATPSTKQEKLYKNQRDLQNFISLLAPEVVPIGGRLQGPLRVPGNDHIPGNIPLYFGKIRTETRILLTSRS